MDWLLYLKYRQQIQFDTAELHASCMDKAGVPNSRLVDQNSYYLANFFVIVHTTVPLQANHLVTTDKLAALFNWQFIP